MRTAQSTGNQVLLATEMEKMNLNILAICEARICGQGDKIINSVSGNTYKIYHSGLETHAKHGVAFMLPALMSE